MVAHFFATNAGISSLCILCVHLMHMIWRKKVRRKGIKIGDCAWRRGFLNRPSVPEGRGRFFCWAWGTRKSNNVHWGGETYGVFMLPRCSRVNLRAWWKEARSHGTLQVSIEVHIRPKIVDNQPTPIYSSRIIMHLLDYVMWFTRVATGLVVDTSIDSCLYRKPTLSTYCKQWFSTKNQMQER